MISLQFLAACQTLGISDRPASALLRTDSTEIGAHMSGYYYLAKIGFAFTNTTPNTISHGGCGGPGFPQVEKKVGEQWVLAYSQVYLDCRNPPMMIPSGETYQAVLPFMASAPGHNEEPSLLVDSIDGTYRLRWAFSEGTGGGYTSARKVEGISNEFHMTLHQ
jgi:hypothetical protein